MITKDIKLHIRYKFNNLENIVATINGDVYQLPYFGNKRMKKFRKINKIIVGGSIGYRINRNFYTSNKIKSLAYKVDEYYVMDKEIICPF